MTRNKKPAQKQSSSTLPQTDGPVTSGVFQVLEIVLKSDVAGTLEAVRQSIAYINVPAVAIRVIQSGVGPVSKSDILMAQTGSRLIVGFNVGTTSQTQQQVMESGIEVRLYDVIYKLSRDLTELAKKMVPRAPEETITGKAEAIAVFKRRKGIVMGCDVTAGVIEMGRSFRIITAMGPVYSGKIESLQIENNPVKRGKAGQQVGIAVSDWKNAKVGDLVECFEIRDPGSGGGWRPNPGIHRL